MQQMPYDIDISVSPLPMMPTSRDGDIPLIQKRIHCIPKDTKSMVTTTESCHILQIHKISYSGRFGYRQGFSDDGGPCEDLGREIHILHFDILRVL